MSKLNIAERVLKIRKDNGFSQKKIFEISGINQGFLSEVEQNKAVPGSIFLLLFYAKFNADINWLLTGEGEPYNVKKSRGPNDNLTPGERVKKLRDFFNLTQDEFGKKLSVNHSFISRVEKNNSAMGAEFLYELNRQLNVNINWLLAGEGSMFLNDSSNTLENVEVSNNTVFSDTTLDTTDKKVLKELVEIFKNPELMNFFKHFNLDCIEAFNIAAVIKNDSDLKMIYDYLLKLSKEGKQKIIKTLQNGERLKTSYEEQDEKRA